MDVQTNKTDEIRERLAKLDRECGEDSELFQRRVKDLILELYPPKERRVFAPQARMRFHVFEAMYLAEYCDNVLPALKQWPVEVDTIDGDLCVRFLKTEDRGSKIEDRPEGA